MLSGRSLTAWPAKIREALDDHEFVFIDGTINTVPAEGLTVPTLGKHTTSDSDRQQEFPT